MCRHTNTTNRSSHARCELVAIIVILEAMAGMEWAGGGSEMEARILAEQGKRLDEAFEKAFKKEKDDRLAKQLAGELKAKLKADKAQQKADSKRNSSNNGSTSLCELRGSSGIAGIYHLLLYVPGTYYALPGAQTVVPCPV